jgi:hypothetical protein
VTEALEAAKQIAGGEDDRSTAAPCAHAEFRRARPCRGHLWMCTNPDCDKEGLTVRGNWCRQQCDARAAPNTVKRARRSQKSDTSLRAERRNPAVDGADAERLPVLSMIFTVYDEDRDEVRATLQSAAAAYPDERLQLVVVDDGGEPVKDIIEAADTGAAEVEYIRNEQNRGVGRARNTGAEAASGEVLSFHDAHMRFPLHDELVETAAEHGHELDIPDGWSSLMCLAVAALRGPSALTDAAVRKGDIVGDARAGSIISSASRDVRRERGFWASGADMFWNRRDGLQPKWRIPRDWDTQWQRVPCMMGAGYFMSRKTARTLAQATGGSVNSGQEKGRPRPGPESGRHRDGHTRPDAAGVWEDTAGLWGFSEQALSVKAFLLDIPIYASRDLYTRHLYRGTNPVQGAGRETWKNVTRCTSRLFPREMFERRFLPYCRKRLGDEAATYRAEPAEVADRAAGRRIFTHLVGKRAPVTKRHPDHDWLDDVRDAALDLKPQTPNPAVLMWRPGEALFTVLQECPDAEITCIVRPGPRANNWWDICGTNDITLRKAKLEGDYVTAPLEMEDRPFDLVLVNGELQDECREVARQVLADGGRVLVNERADRMQLEDDRRREEEEKVAAALEKRDSDPREMSGPAEDRAKRDKPHTPNLTVCLLNWRRPENLDPILDALAAQTAAPRVWLWDNSGDADPDDPRVDRVVSAGENMGCMPRWWLASAAETEYVCSLDDDLKPADAEVLEDMMEVCAEREVPGIVGPFGWRGRGQFRAGGEVDYRGGQHIGAGAENVAVDLVKGRCMMLHRRLLRRVPLEPPLPDGARIDRSELLTRCDDIYLNVMTAGGQPERHLVPRVLEGRFEELGGQDGRALATDPGHYEARGRAIESLLTCCAERSDN